MKPGVSTSETIGSPCASHSCMKRAALSAASASIAPPRCGGLLAISADRPALDAGQRGDDAGAEAGAQLEQRAGVDERRRSRARMS